MAVNPSYERDIAQQQERQDDFQSTIPDAFNYSAISGVGCCGFRDPTSGVTCGCRGFWQNPILVVDGSPNFDGCACGHHACFHTGDGHIQGAFATTGAPMSQGVQPAALILGQLQEVVRLLSGTVSNGPIQPQLLPAGITEGTVETLPPSSLPGQMGPNETAPESPYQFSFSKIMANFDAINESEAQAAGLGVIIPDAQQIVEETQIMSNQEPLALDVPRLENPSATTFMRLLQAFNPGTPDPNLPSTIADSLLPFGNSIPRSEPSSNHGHVAIESNFSNRASSIDGTTSDHNSIPPAIISSTIENATMSKVMAPPGSRQLTPGHMKQVAEDVVTTPSRILTPSSYSGTPPVRLRDAASIHELGHYLNALRSLVSRHGSQLRGVFERLDNVETVPSFSQPRDQELCDKVEAIEARMVDIESNVDRHDRVLEDIDIDPEEDRLILRKKQRLSHDEGSVVSQTSATNSIPPAIIAGQITPVDMKERILHLEDRISEIERHLPPSSTRPLAIEVVYIPWGRDLRGLWVQPEVSKVASSRYTTQDPEEWTNSQNAPSASRLASSLKATNDSGWSSLAIHEWAIHADEWLEAKACGAKSVVYHRLKSRGFVKTINLVKPGARDIQEAVVNVFTDLLDAMPFAETEGMAKEDERLDSQVSRSLGLNAPFVPLRKITGVSRLQFLTKSEMVTPALWTSEFLVSNVIMKTAGGPRRLFVTRKDGYIQRHCPSQPSWNWDMIRALPAAGSDVAYDDRCWEKHSILDAPPPSLSTSFTSQQSATPPPSPRAAKRDVTSQNVAHMPPPSSCDDASEIMVSRSLGPITPITNAGHSMQESGRRMASKTPDRRLHSRETSYLSLNDFNYPHPSGEEDYWRTDNQEAWVGHIVSGAVPPPHVIEKLSGLQDDILDSGTDDLDIDDESMYQDDENDNQSHSSRYNLRPFNRTVSNPTTSKPPRLAQPPTRSVSATTTINPPKRPRGFENPSNPLLSQIPNWIPNSSGPSAAKSRKPASKRRRLSSFGTYDSQVQVRHQLQRSRSGSFAQSRQAQGKRAVTPINPYATPYSGNFHDGSSPAGPLSNVDVEFDGTSDDEHDTNHDEAEEEEEWKGVVDEDDAEIDVKMPVPHSPSDLDLTTSQDGTGSLGVESDDELA